jgi:hypothetical protein
MIITKYAYEKLTKINNETFIYFKTPCISGMFVALQNMEMARWAT